MTSGRLYRSKHRQSSRPRWIFPFYSNSPIIPSSGPSDRSGSRSSLSIRRPRRHFRVPIECLTRGIGTGQREVSGVVNGQRVVVECDDMGTTLHTWNIYFHNIAKCIPDQSFILRDTDCERWMRIKLWSRWFRISWLFWSLWMLPGFAIAVFSLLIKH